MHEQKLYFAIKTYACVSMELGNKIGFLEQLPEVDKSPPTCGSCAFNYILVANASTIESIDSYEQLHAQ